MFQALHFSRATQLHRGKWTVVLDKGDRLLAFTLD